MVGLLNMKKINFLKKLRTSAISILVLCGSITTAQAATSEVISPMEGIISDEAYSPGSEPIIANNEMRVVVLGSGLLPVAMEQASACFFVELGNGDKFLFDVGSQCHSRIAAQKIAYNYMDKLFLSRLHSDNIADLPSFWLGGTVMNRITPLRIWGPSGDTPQLGTQHTLNVMHEMYAWDRATRGGVIDARGMVLNITEIDHTASGKVVYDKSGVIIRSFASAGKKAGSISYGLEWNGLKFAYAGSTKASKEWIDYAKGGDIVIHQAKEFAHAMAQIQPRMGIVGNFHNNAVNSKALRSKVAETYQGSYAIGADYLTFNVSKEAINVRRGIEDPEIWPIKAPIPKIPEVDKLYIIGLLTGYSQAAVLPMTDVVLPIYQELNEQHGTDYYPISSYSFVKALKDLRSLKRKVTFSDPADE